jgi:N-acetylneuraminate lyase
LAKHAQQAGVAGISSILPPLARTTESIYLHYQGIAAAAPELPFFPYLFGGTVDALTLMRALVDRIPSLAGTKYTGPNMYELSHLVVLGQDRWTVFSGMDEQCILAAMFGAQGNIGSTLNLMPGAYREIRKSYRDGDLARAQDLQLRANKITRVLISYGFHGALREALGLLGFDCGEPRLPNPPLPSDKRQPLHDELMDAGFAALTAM